MSPTGSGETGDNAQTLEAINLKIKELPHDLHSVSLPLSGDPAFFFCPWRTTKKIMEGKTRNKREANFWQRSRRPLVFRSRTSTSRIRRL